MILESICFYAHPPIELNRGVARIVKIGKSKKLTLASRAIGHIQNRIVIL